MKWVRWFAFVFSAVFVGMQFVKPSLINPPSDPVLELRAPEHVQPILDRACNDCHSNHTEWPWYSNIAPISWWLVDHVTEGREEMSFSEWGSYSTKNADHLLEEICEQVEKGYMPLPEYLWLHPEAKLTPEEKRILCEWAKSERTKIRAQSADGRAQK